MDGHYQIVNKFENLSLNGQEISTFYEAIRIGLDRGEPDACKQAARTIVAAAAAAASSSKAATTTDSSCWNLVARLYDQALKSNDLESCFELAWLYFAGVGVPQKSFQKALDCWQRVITESNDKIFKTISLYMVGMCYHLGIGTELDLVEGWRLIGESLSVNDEFVLAKRWAFDWIWGHPIDAIEASSPLSRVFFDHVSFGSDNNQVLKHLEGVCYFYGFGTSKDQSKAVEIFQALADSGFAPSQVVYGSCYFDGYVVQRSLKNAAELFHKASEQGYAWGQNALGDCYRDGFGIWRDYTKANEWYRKAADQGHAEAQTKLGFCYQSGYGVSHDNDKATQWYRTAVIQGDADAKALLTFVSRTRKFSFERW